MRISDWSSDVCASDLAKVQLVPGILRVNGALFYYDYSNKQLLGTVPVPVLVRLSSLVSVPKSHVQGAELDVELRPVTVLSLSVSGTYVEGEDARRVGEECVVTCSDRGARHH